MINDLHELARTHLDSAKADDNGRSSHLFLHEGPLRQTLIALTAGSKLSEHVTPGAASLFIVTGRIRLASAETILDLTQGHLTPIPHNRHTLEALEDSAVVLTTVIV
jgi:quercetin dioxygenase-like cupin family protein